MHIACLERGGEAALCLPPLSSSLSCRLLPNVLGDICRLCRHSGGNGVGRKHVGRNRCVYRGCKVETDEVHRLSLGQPACFLLQELFVRKLPNDLHGWIHLHQRSRVAHPPPMSCRMVAVCVALATATESAVSTFAATAALTGAATLALMRSNVSRSGRNSARCSSSSRTVI